MAFEEQLPKWENEGTEPPQSKQVEGWQPNEKPPASWFNWLFGRAYKVMQELQEKAETIDGAQAKADAATAAAKDYTDLQISKIVHETDETVTVGLGGDFSSINEALAYFSTRIPTYKHSGLTAEIKLLSGFVMSEQVYVRGIDLGWIKITSEDNEVPINRSTLTQDYFEYPAGQKRYPAFTARENATLPIISTLFNMDDSGDAEGRDAFFILQNSKITISEGAGCRNAGGRALYVLQASQANAEGSILSGAGDNAVTALHNCWVNVQDADCSGAARRGIFANASSRIGARRVNVSGAGGAGLLARRAATIDAYQGNISNCGNSEDAAVEAWHASTINVQEADVTNSKGMGIRSFHASTINAHQVDVSGAMGHGVVAARCSSIDISNSTIHNVGGDGVRADASRINAYACDVQGANEYGIHALNGGEINAEETHVSGSGFSGIRANHGSKINAESCVVDNSANNDIIVEGGSIISAHGATGSLSQSENNITSDGIIFQ